MSSLSEEVRTEVFCGYICDAEAENAKLRDEIKRRDELEAKLIKCIENDYGILFSWDPLRKVWLSECTDEYVTDRERLETENAELRKELADAPKCETCEAMLDCNECLRADGSHKERRRLDAENAKLRKLVHHWSEVAHLTHVRYENVEKLASKMSVIRQMMQELGIEVE